MCVSPLKTHTEVIQMKQLYCGLDVHKDNYVGCLMDKEGKIQAEKTIPPTLEGIKQFIGHIPNSHLTIALESCGIWRGAWRHLTSLGYDVKLANPVKTNAIAVPNKTDKVDAKILADLLRTGYLPEVYIPNEEIIRFREIARHKAMLVRFRTMLQVKIKWYLLRDGIPYQKRIWTEKGIAWLKSLDKSYLDSYIRMYEAFKQEEKEYMKILGNISRNGRITNLLRTCQGIGEFAALLIAGEVGTIKRFQDRKHFIGYCGLAGGRYQSSKTDRSVKRTSYNRWLKWIFVCCSGRAAMLPGKFQAYYHGIKKRKGAKTAKIATARKMAEIIYEMLKHEQPYCP